MSGAEKRTVATPAPRSVPTSPLGQSSAWISGNGEPLLEYWVPASRLGLKFEMTVIQIRFSSFVSLLHSVTDLDVAWGFGSPCHLQYRAMWMNFRALGPFKLCGHPCRGNIGSVLPERKKQNGDFECARA